VRAFLLGVSVLSACVPVRRRAETDLVHDVSFQGNGGLLSGQNDYQLRAQMQQREARFGLLVWPLVYTVDPVTLDRDRLLRDGFRLEVWYAHHGWFDAKVVGWELRQIRPETKRKAAVVDVRGIVEPGPQSTVRSLKIEGPPWMQVLASAVLRDSSIREGDPYSRDLLEETRQKLVNELERQAHPYAIVSLEATAHPDERAVDVVLKADPGIEGRLGEIRVSGNDKVKDLFVDETLDLHPGDPYSIQKLQAAQQRLFGLGTFSLATVEPDLSDNTRSEVPVDVTLTESRFRTFRIGAGGEYDGYTATVRASTKLTHVNLLHQLIRADLGGQVGLAFDLANGAGTSNFPTWGVRLALKYPRVFTPRLSLDLDGRMEQDVYVGLWNYRRPVVDLGLSWKFTDQIKLRVGPHFENYVFLDDRGHQVVNANAQEQLFGLSGGTTFEYRLSALDQLFTVDWRNDPIQPTRGTQWTLALREAVPITDIGYGFVRGGGSVSGYVPIRFRDLGSAYPFTIAMRGDATAMTPYGSTTDIPLPERAFLGGSTSIRGFRPKSVGPYTVFCDYSQVPVRTGFLGLGGQKGNQTTEQVSTYYIPQGGDVASEASAELRYDWAYGVTLAAFADGGALWAPGDAVSSDLLRWSAGIGARYNTVVGPIRLDLSARPLFPEDTTRPQFVGCQPADRIPRTYDLLGVFGDPTRLHDHPPFALVLFLTLGEAF
jgi:translocation and assembly module TamA